MGRLIGWIALILAFAAATVVLGWWGVPAVGAIWGLIRDRRGAWVAVAATAAIAWAVLLAAAMADGFGILLSQLDGALRLPALAVAILTVILPAVLAGSAAELAVVIRTAVAAYRRSAEGEG